MVSLYGIAVKNLLSNFIFKSVTCFVCNDLEILYINTIK